MLATTLDYEATLANVVRLAVPRVADWCAVDIVTPDGSRRTIAGPHPDPEKDRALRELERFGRDTTGEVGVARVMRTGVADVRSKITDAELRAGARDEEHLALLRELDPQSFMIVPLVARSRTLGAMIFISTTPGRGYRSEDLLFAEDLARRCALAVDNARLYAEAHEAQRAERESLALLDTLFGTAPVGLGFLDSNLRFVRVNDKLAAINGVPPHAHTGRTVAEVLPDMGPSVLEVLRRVLETGDPIVDMELTGVTPAAPGLTRTWMASYYPVLAAEGTTIGVGTVVVDITDRTRAEEERARLYEAERRALAEAEEERRRVSLLADASAVMDESLDHEITLGNLGHLVVPRLADWFVVDLVADDRSIERVAVTHDDPVKANEAWELGRRFPSALDREQGMGAVIRTGEPALLGDVSELFTAEFPGEEARAMISGLGLRSGVIAPLRARGRILGAMAAATAESGREFGERDLALVTELARRTALALDNARLYQDRARVARTLQASLLPADLPEVPGLALAARYRAAGEGNDVGGDFYDVFESNGSWWAVIGDVCGKGAPAAAVTAQARYTIRAAAIREDLPSRILGELNDALVRQHGGDEFATVALARLDTVEGRTRITVAVGGHPLPLLLRADGAVEAIGRPGTVPGIVMEPEFADISVELGPGDTVLLFTDGVTEARVRSWELGEEGLTTLLASLAGRDTDAIVQVIVDTVVAVQGGDPRDDIALVALQAGAA